MTTAFYIILAFVVCVVAIFLSTVWAVRSGRRVHRARMAAFEDYRARVEAGESPGWSPMPRVVPPPERHQEDEIIEIDEQGVVHGDPGVLGKLKGVRANEGRRRSS